MLPPPSTNAAETGFFRQPTRQIITILSFAKEVFRDCGRRGFRLLNEIKPPQPKRDQIVGLPNKKIARVQFSYMNIRQNRAFVIAGTDDHIVSIACELEWGVPGLGIVQKCRK